MVEPPALPETQALHERLRTRTVRFARSSSLCLILLGGLSALVNALHPLTASFVISALVVANGVVEWRGSTRLKAGNASALRSMAWNQVAVGLEILAYGLWQARFLTDASILQVLDRPLIKSYLDLLPSGDVRLLLDLIPPTVRQVYLVVGGAGLLGCLGVAQYYRLRRRRLAGVARNSPSA